MTTISRIALILLFALAAEAFGQGSDKAQPPKLAPPPSMKLPPIVHFKLSNGVDVRLMEKHEVSKGDLLTAGEM